MRKVIIFEKYELSENGMLININTGKQIKVEISANKRVAKLYVDKKTKRVNIDDLIDENFPKEEIKEEKKEVKRNASRKYEIKVTQLDGEVKIFKTFKAANDFYGLRKDYLNYCLTEPYFYMLTKNGLQLKSVEKIEK